MFFFVVPVALGNVALCLNYYYDPKVSPVTLAYVKADN